MKTSFVLLAAALLLPAAATFAQSPVALAYRPTARANSDAPASEAPGSYSRRVAGGGSITYFGTVASHDAQHEQFARLRQAFEDSKATVVFFENSDSGTDSTEAATISRTGPAGYARFLAHQHQVPAERLDNNVAEYEYLRTKTDPEQLKLFCLLRQTQRFQAYTNASKALTTKAMQELIAHSAAFLPGTEQVIHNLAEFETAYRKYCPAGTKWWQAPADWFNPNVAAAGPGNAYIKDLNTAVGAFREQYMYRKLAELAQAGQRVFVVVDRANVPAQGPPAYAAQTPTSR